MPGKYNFAIDRGGTFTDVLAQCPNNEVRTLKLLSEDTAHYADAPTEGIRRILTSELGANACMNANGQIKTEHIGWIRMGTTVATNALLERKGDDICLVVTKGFRHLLEIGNQSRPKIFDLNIRKPSNLYKKVVEIDCRLVPDLKTCELDLAGECRRIAAKSGGGDYFEMRPPNVQEIEQQLVAVLGEGIKAIAVVLAHSYACPDHELVVGDIARRLGFEYVILSHEAMPMCKLVGRGFTACAEAYLTPHVHRYLDNFKRGFEDELRDVSVLFMQSDGGLTEMSGFRGARAILSGPAGGVVGFAQTGKKQTSKPLIGFDMGGTSTDVSRFDGDYEHVIESTTAGVTIKAPQLDINTVAAGGGSMLFFRSGMFAVGPESAGANPGPACYRKGGPLTVTDANLMLGRLLPEYFPKIFGQSESEALDKDAATLKFQALQKEINSQLNKELSVAEVAMGFLRVANEAMCRPIRALTQARGYDTSQHVLCCFGGAGGQHACSIANTLKMNEVFIHKYAGILSAYGMALADCVSDKQSPFGDAFEIENASKIQTIFDALKMECRSSLAQQGITEDVGAKFKFEYYLHLRYLGTDTALMCLAKQPNKELDTSNFDVASNFDNFRASLVQRYESEFGFVLDRPIICDDIRVRLAASIGDSSCDGAAKNSRPANAKPQPVKWSEVYFENVSEASDGFVKTPVYLMTDLLPNDVINGPAIIIDQLSTIVVEIGVIATITPACDVHLQIKGNSNEQTNKSAPIEMDAIQLSIFGHRFMSIAEQMGHILQRTSISTNIKERLDFSCALFGPDGGLVSNAPHIPVHLGAMQETVQYQLNVRGKSLKPGDVILSNHPQAGGSHLPDLTVITPVFHENKGLPIFFVASRGHHADIGGATPGSMPPHSKSLSEEGVAIKSMLLVAAGVFQEEELEKQFTLAGARNFSDNISDLKAQIAANQKGIQLVTDLIASYSLPVVQSYMNFIQENAELAVRDLLKGVAKRKSGDSGSNKQHVELFAYDQMDDGSEIKLLIQINPEDGTAVFDFSGTSYENYGNLNAPRAITLSALIYCLRSMITYDIPLNQGCLRPVTVIISPGSMLNPSENAAVVGGNVLTSQRIVDCVFSAFETCAASCGCMNNITIGDASFGYYETVGGGSGAGPTYHGVGGVHTHMTNTRITDLEILEQRYPMILQRFELRNDQSGGAGQYCGGEGIHREMLFRKSLHLSVLTERRVFKPYGMKGGRNGKRGRNLLFKKDGRVINLASRNLINVDAGDLFSMQTPGGGGFGVASSEPESESVAVNKVFTAKGSIFEYRSAQESV